jgi:hypothetical protein
METMSWALSLFKKWISVLVEDDPNMEPSSNWSWGLNDLLHWYDEMNPEKKNQKSVQTWKIFRDVMPCSLVDIYQYFEGMYCFHLQVETVNPVSSKQLTAMAYSLSWRSEVVHFFKISVNIYQNTWCNISEDNTLCSHCHGNLRSHCRIWGFHSSGYEDDTPQISLFRIFLSLASSDLIICCNW